MTDNPSTPETSADLFESDQPREWGKLFKKIPFLSDLIDPKERVAVIRFAGVIADTTMMRRAGVNYQKFREAIPDAFDVSRVRAIALLINSPGGAPAQCSLISERIRALSEDRPAAIVILSLRRISPADRLACEILRKLRMTAGS